MQRVPTSGARDAYQYVYKKDKVVNDVYLYNPDNNVHLGTAFLRRLNSDYLGGDQVRSVTHVCQHCGLQYRCE